jgi:hypothetical protein
MNTRLLMVLHVNVAAPQKHRRRTARHGTNGPAEQLVLVATIDVAAVRG